MKNLLKPLQAVAAILRKYVVVIVFIIFGAMYGYLIITSGKQAENQPSEAQINEQFQGAARPKIDESVAATLQQLEEQNIEIQSIFDEARNNPFNE